MPLSEVGARSARRRPAPEVVGSARTWLFVPGNAGPRLQKAHDSSADEVILDLEDAVAPAEKDAARTAVVDWLTGGGSAWVRINGAETPWYADDVAVLATVRGLRGVILPKCQRGEDAAHLRSSLPADIALVGLVESAMGIRDVDTVAASGVDRLAFGALDFATDVESDPEDEVVGHARARLVIASRAAGIPAPVDGVTPSLDPAVVSADSRRARRSGFRGKLCIHPAQLMPADEALRPSDDEIDWARRVVAAMTGGGVVLLDGAMVDTPVVERARRLLC